MISLPDNEIHTWVAQIDDFDFAELQAITKSWLTDLERRRLERFYFVQHKKQLLLGRLLMRSVLSHYEAISPQQWQFCYNDYGKPMLTDQQQQRLSAPLYFNLSHSHGSIVLAVARIKDIGIDIECNTRSRRFERIASRYFSDIEVGHLLQLDEPSWRARFYDLWSLKEAYIKACGMGLAIDLGHFSFLFTAPDKLDIEFDKRRADDASRWQFWQLSGAVDFNLALAAKSDTGQKIKAVKQYALNPQSFVELPLQILRSS